MNSENSIATDPAHVSSMSLTHALQDMRQAHFGGALISPISTVFSKVLGRSGKQAGNNPLLNMAMASTF